MTNLMLSIIIHKLTSGNKAGGGGWWWNSKDGFCNEAYLLPEVRCGMFMCMTSECWYLLRTTSNTCAA